MSRCASLDLKSSSSPVRWGRPGWYSKAFSSQPQYREALPVVSEGDLETLLSPEPAVSYTNSSDITYLPYTDVRVESRGGLLGVRRQSRDPFYDESVDNLLPTRREADGGNGRAGFNQPVCRHEAPFGDVFGIPKY